MSKGTVIVPSLYRILTRAPQVVTEGSEEAKGIVPLPPLYATAPVNKGDGSKLTNLGPITLDKENPSGSRQIV